MSDLVADLNELRRRVLSGESFSAEEYAQIMVKYREARGVAVEKAAPGIKARAAGPAAALPLGDLIANIMAKKENG